MSNKIQFGDILMGAAFVAACGAMVAFGTPANADYQLAEPVEPPPYVVWDECNMKEDENGVMECSKSYSDGHVDYYWVKDGLIYYDYPIDSRVPHGGVWGA